MCMWTNFAGVDVIRFSSVEIRVWIDPGPLHPKLYETDINDVLLYFVQYFYFLFILFFDENIRSKESLSIT
jgi:hypothetical protein